MLFTSRTRVEVVDRSIENLALTATPLIETPAIVTLNSEPLANRATGPLMFSVEPVRGLAPFLLEEPGHTFEQILDNLENGLEPDKQTGVFTIPKLALGTYKFTPRLPPQMYIDDIRQGPVSVYNGGFLAGDVAKQPVEILLGSPAGLVTGTIENAKKEPIGGATVLIIPDGIRRADPGRWLSSRANGNGLFGIFSIAPGTYKIFAWESIPDQAWRNEDVLRKYESRGQVITIDKGASLRLELTAIPKEQE